MRQIDNRQSMFVVGEGKGGKEQDNVHWMHKYRKNTDKTRGVNQLSLPFLCSGVAQILLFRHFTQFTSPFPTSSSSSSSSAYVLQLPLNLPIKITTQHNWENRQSTAHTITTINADTPTHTDTQRHTPHTLKTISELWLTQPSLQTTLSNKLSQYHPFSINDMRDWLFFFSQFGMWEIYSHGISRI